MGIPSEGKVVVQFGAAWCQPCKQVRPLVEELAEKNGAEFIYVDIGVNTGTDLANAMNVRSVPTIVAIKDGTELGRSTSAAPNMLRTTVNASFGN